MLVPALFALTNGLPGFQPDPAFTYASSMGASLMLGWTALLLWADRRPAERKGVLALTLLPVLAGLILSGIRAATSGFIGWSALAPTWVLQGALMALFAYSYLSARAAESHGR